MSVRNYTVQPHEYDHGLVYLEVTDNLGKTSRLEVQYTDLINHELGIGYIQDNFPYLSPAERELLMTGISAEEWANIFPDE